MNYEGGMMNYMNMDYMGDGVYIEFTGYSFILRANDHRESHCTDTIHIEPQVLDAINSFALRMEKKTK